MPVGGYWVGDAFPQRAPRVLGPFHPNEQGRIIERRYFHGSAGVMGAPAVPIEDRGSLVADRFADPANPNHVRGLAAPFESPSMVMVRAGQKFVEIFERGAFANTLVDSRDAEIRMQYGGVAEIRLLEGHLDTRQLAVQPDTLDLGEGPDGLHFSADIGGTPFGRELAKEVKASPAKRGMSVGFVIPAGGDRWSNWTEPGILLRRISRVLLIEASIVASPAYKKTEVRDDGSNAAGPRYFPHLRLLMP